MVSKDKKRSDVVAEQPTGQRVHWWLKEVVLPVVILGGLAIVCLVISWRRWPDLLIDFGRELYIPWRLSAGAVLYRDVDDFYGPLSQYANATLFSLFGPGLMVLVTANLAIFAAIVAILYVLLRRAWNLTAAIGASVVFVTIFGFSRWSTNGNFNYATPYAHETTHGVLVLLLLTLALAWWSDRISMFSIAIAGWLWGLTLVLKPEIALAGAAITTGAVLLHVHAGGHWRWVWLPVWGVAASLPTLFFVGFFLRYFSWNEAWSAACRGWLNVIATSDYVSGPSQAKFLGLDDIGSHLRDYAHATGLAFAGIGWIALAAVAVDRLRSRIARTAVVVAMLAGLLWSGFSSGPGDWLKAGTCLPALVLLVMCWEGVRLCRGKNHSDRPSRLRVLLAVLGASLLVRMALNARISDFGYYQAPFAAVVIIAFLLGEFPRIVAVRPAARAAAIAGVVALIGSGVCVLANENRLKYGLIDYPVSEGSDRFYTYRAEVLAQSQVLADITEALRKTKGGQSLLVLPEGEMINYLARMPSPLAPFYFFASVTEHGKERLLVEQLAKAPPDWVLLVTRDLREFGIQHYGERVGAGKELLDWVKLNYETWGIVNGEPMDYQRHGLQLLRRRTDSAH